MAHVEDRWFRTEPGARPEDRPVRIPTARNGVGKRYRVRYIDPAGRERGRSFDRKTDADRFCSTTGADILRGSYIDPDAGRVTVRKYAEDWLRVQTFEESTRERVEQRLRTHVYPVLGDLTLAQLAQRPSTVKAWLGGLGVANIYARAILANLSTILSAAVDDGLIMRNPCKTRSVTAPRPDKKKVVPWPRTRVAAVRSNLPAHYQALADAGAGLGLRQGEAFGLSPDDIDWLRGVVHVRRQVKIVRNRLCFAPPKGRRERDVPLPESVKLRLSAHLAAFPAVAVTLPWKAPAGQTERVMLMFTTRERNAITRHWFNTASWQPALEAAGVIPPRDPDKARLHREHGFHALRHHFASVLLSEGEDIRTLAEYLGHSDPGFTLRVYAHFIPGREDRMRGIIDGSLGDADSRSDGLNPARDAR